MNQGTLQGIGTILTMLAFLGVCWWAFSKHKKADFEEASRLPFADEQRSTSSGEDGDDEREDSPQSTNEADRK